MAWITSSVSASDLSVRNSATLGKNIDQVSFEPVGFINELNVTLTTVSMNSSRLSCTSLRRSSEIPDTFTFSLPQDDSQLIDPKVFSCFLTSN